MLESQCVASGRLTGLSGAGEAARGQKGGGGWQHTTGGKRRGVQGSTILGTLPERAKDEVQRGKPEMRHDLSPKREKRQQKI